MSDTVWGLYPWFEENGRHLVHSDDYEAIKALFPYGKVFESVGVEGEYLKLQYGSQIYRVMPELFRPVPAPVRRFGEVVSAKKGGELISVAIRDIMWHFKEERPYFFVTAGNKRLSKRYWAEDFIESPH